LRDTLISAYFSLKFSHPVITPLLAERRRILQSASMEDGLLYLMDQWLPSSAAVQKSWLEASEPIVKYEDLLQNDIQLLGHELVEVCGIGIDRSVLETAILENRFENVTKGRNRGQEDVNSHQRKGLPGDWRNFFSQKVIRSFEHKYGSLLLAAGYESCSTWSVKQ
jgi:lipopolysaccharide transport system ATP-binding protein